MSIKVEALSSFGRRGLVLVLSRTLVFLKKPLTTVIRKVGAFTMGAWQLVLVVNNRCTPLIRPVRTVVHSVARFIRFPPPMLIFCTS